MTETIIPQGEDVFNIANKVTFSKVVSLFYGQEPDKNGKIYCPFHDDANPSLHLYSDHGYCFGACKWSGDGIAFVAELKNIRPVEAANLIAEKFNLSSSQPVVITDKKTQGQEKSVGYDYHDEQGNLLFQVCRRWDDEKKDKTFYQRRPDGKGGFINGLGNIKPVLYWLPEVKKAISENKRIYIPEGEKDVDNLIGLGLMATTNPMGAGKWKDHYADTLKEACIVVLPDNDQIGEEHAQQVVNSLKGNAASIKMLRLDGLPEKGDVSDWLEAGGTAEQLEALANETPEWQPESEVEQWCEPEQFKASLLPVEQLPSDIIPEPLRAWVKDVAYRMQVPTDMVAAGVMVAAGSVVGAGCGIRPKQNDDWLVIPNLWGGVIGDPGSLKTPALKDAISAITHLETDAKAKYDEEFDYHEADREAYKAKKEALKGEMQKAAKNKSCSTLDELKLQMMNLGEPDPPVWKRFITNDSTIEMMGELLKQNPRGILLFRDELTGLLSSWDREGRETDRAFYLEAWNGYGSITTDRIGRGTVRVDNLCVSILGGIQPAKLLSYLYQATSALDNDGLIQRMQLMVYPDKLTGYKNVDESPDHNAKDRAYKAIKTLTDMDFNEYGAKQSENEQNPYFQFTEPAQSLFNEWLTDLQMKLQGDESPIMLEHLAKYRSLMPTLALVDHLLNIADGFEGGSVSLESAKKAAAWCSYLESHAKRIYGLIGNVGQKAAIELSKKLKNKKLHDGFTIRDIYRNGWHLLTTKEAVKAACEELEEAGWLKNSIAQDGRTRTIYQINPKIFL